MVKKFFVPNFVYPYFLVKPKKVISNNPKTGSFGREKF